MKAERGKKADSAVFLIFLFLYLAAKWKAKDTNNVRQLNCIIPFPANVCEDNVYFCPDAWFSEERTEILGRRRKQTEQKTVNKSNQKNPPGRSLRRSTAS